ncbi:MAG: cytochrome C [Desulfuromonas sp.]|nr:MAG: cytochrome C [Desulfuromonas sp.]
MKRVMILSLVLMLLPATLLAERWIEDKVNMPTDDVGTVMFSHYVHLDAVGKNCTACHNRLYNVETGKNPVFTMADMEQGKACGSCHNGQRAFTVKENCTVCHAAPEKKIVTAEVGTVLFSHELHTEMFGCTDCHSDLFIAGPGNPQRTMAEMEEGESCGACHDGDTAFSVAGDCASCHAAPEKTFTVEDAGNVLFSHEVHTEMFGCGDCHSDLFTAVPGNPTHSMEQMEQGESCGACHDGDTAFSVAEDCESCHDM